MHLILKDLKQHYVYKHLQIWIWSVWKYLYLWMNMPWCTKFIMSSKSLMFCLSYKLTHVVSFKLKGRKDLHVQLHWQYRRVNRLHMSQVAHLARACPSFCSIKRLGEFYSPVDRMLVHSAGLFAAWSFVETIFHLGGVVSHPRTQRNVPGKGLSLNPEVSALIIRPPCLSRNSEDM